MHYRLPWHGPEQQGLANLEFKLTERVVALTGGAVSSFDRVDGLMIHGKDVHVDDIILSGSKLERSFALNAGAVIGQYLGEQTGPNASGGAVATWFQYNDLGTVLAQTDSAGAASGVWLPDFYGNYRARSTSSPNSPLPPKIGITSKFYDADNGLWHFNARWYDQERGRWVSNDKLIRFSRYQFSNDNPSLFFDFNGYFAVGTSPFPPLPPGGTIPLPHEIDPLFGLGYSAANISQCVMSAFIQNYYDMVDANWQRADPYFHCKAHCEASQCGGVAMGLGIGAIREIFGLITGDGLRDVLNDSDANRQGAMGGLDPCADCKDVCDNHRPPGLPTRY